MHILRTPFLRNTYEGPLLDIFMGYRNGILTWNELRTLYDFETLTNEAK